MSPRFLLALALTWCWPLESASRAATDGLVPYNVRIWQSDDGLPQNSVYAIAQTSDGCLWVGTPEGLARFDGALRSVNHREPLDTARRF